MKISSNKYSVILCLFLATPIIIFCMKQPERLLKQELITLKNHLDALAKSLAKIKPSVPYKRSREEEAFSIEPIAKTIIKRLIPTTIKTEEQLLSVLQALTTFAQLNKKNRDLF